VAVLAASRTLLRAHRGVVEPACPGADRGGSGFAGRVAWVTGLVIAGFGVAVSLQVVLADVQAGKLPAGEVGPAKCAGRDERAGHGVLHCFLWESAALQVR
jgi:hypothetical protein